MNTRDRYLEKTIVADLKEKMVFIGGPRQVGKTTLAKLIGSKNYKNPQYLNWDNREDRKNIIAGSFQANADLLVFDELHKFKNWKNYLKGIFDKYRNRYAILVTGSARLDLYRKGGDSLLGRYHHYRLHPFSLVEINKNKTVQKPMKELKFPDKNPGKTAKIFKELFEFGGFPEPLFHKSQKVLRRWHNDRLDRLIKEDIRDTTVIRDLSGLQVLVELMEEKAAGQLSVNSLREDLQVNHKTASLWVDILEQFYFHFRVYPFAAKTIKSLRKEAKIYLWDWSAVKEESKKLENIVASHLLKFVHLLKDEEGYKADLHYLRDTSGREVDFLVSIYKKPWFAVEVKNSSEETSPWLNYYKERLKIPFLYQIVNKPDINIIQNNVQIIS
ncbi:MAG: ATP-binding protein, partial [Patescibacteria group bacterium]